MSELQDAVQEYLAIRHGLGFALRGLASGLRNFVAFLEHEGAASITTELALRWATQPAQARPATWADRLGMVRRFAAWRRGADPRTEVPPAGLLPHRHRRIAPYLYSDQEIERLLAAARQLPSAKGLRALTYSTLFGLLAVSGMRINEALGLDRADVDLVGGVLTIRRTKYGKSRLVPLHASSTAALQRYADRRDGILRALTTRAFFVSERGTRITDCMARYTFARVSQRIGVRPSTAGRRHGRGPRLHDMRHRFAARRLLEWYRAGRDAERELPKLAAYLGHVHVADTYWYLEALPELLQLATERVIDRAEEGGA
jgi:integrase